MNDEQWVGLRIVADDKTPLSARVTTTDGKSVYGITEARVVVRDTGHVEMKLDVLPESVDLRSDNVQIVHVHDLGLKKAV